MIPCQRELFEIPGDIAYLNCAYMSPLLKSAARATERAVKGKLAPWSITAADFFTATEEARRLFGRLIDAEPDDVAVTPSASYGISTAAANLPVRAGQKIVLLEDQFPSNVYPWRSLAQRVGAETETVARPSDGEWTPAVLDAIDDDTAVVALPNYHWTDGGLVDLVRVGEKCRRRGAALVIDVTQSLGVTPLSVAEIQPDFLIAATYKWLLGPYGFGFLYVAPRWQTGRPLEENWINRAGAEDFAGLVDYRDEYAPGARRFDFGERSSFFLTPAAVAGLEQILDWGPPDIAATLGRMTADISARAESLGLEVLDESLRAPHILGLRFPQGLPADLLSRLAEGRVFVSVRGDSVRVAPHLYNNQADIERFFEALEKVI